MKSKITVFLILAALLVVTAGIGTPKQVKKLKRTDARILARILEVCPPLPDKSGFAIPGYKSVQCFYKEQPDGSLVLVEDLNNPVSIPKPVLSK